MDAERFDRIAKIFAARASRRRVVRGLAAVGVGSGVLGPGAAGAQRAPGVSNGSGPTIEGTDPTCKGIDAISNKSCQGTLCAGSSSCLCAVSVNGDKKCVQVNGVCPNEDECDRNSDCAAGEVCIKVGGCCGGRKFNQCASHCV